MAGFRLLVYTAEAKAEWRINNGQTLTLQVIVLDPNQRFTFISGTAPLKMNVIVLALVCVTALVARSDDGEWVHLPNKCEGRFK